MNRFGLRLVRTYATRRAERPQTRMPDPLAHVEGTQVAPNLTFYHRPPPSAPSPESLTTAPSSPLLREPTGRSSRLPPPLHGSVPPEKKYHLSETQINEIRRLRAADPIANTRSKLAKQFNTTSWFVSSVSKITKERRQKLEEDLEKQRGGWGERKRIAVEVRRKRRDFW